MARAAPSLLDLPLFHLTLENPRGQILRKCPIGSILRHLFWKPSSGLARLASMDGQCVSGQTEMSTVKACPGSEGAGKWCANELLSVQWHYK